LPVAFSVVAATEIIPRLRSVDEHQIYMVESQLFQGLVDGRYGFVVVFNLRGELRRHEELVPGESGGADTFADTSLVTIGLGGIEVSVTDFHGIPDRLRGFIVVNEPGASARLG